MAATHPDQLASRSAWHGVHCSKLPPDRRGRLQNGNRSGDFLAAPRCGARTAAAARAANPRCPTAAAACMVASAPARAHPPVAPAAVAPAGSTAPALPKSAPSCAKPACSSAAPTPSARRLLRWAWGPSFRFGLDHARATGKGEPQRRGGAEMPRQRNRPHIDDHVGSLARAKRAPSFPSQRHRPPERHELGLSAPLRLCG
jgi:hypothetical protein